LSSYFLVIRKATVSWTDDIHEELHEMDAQGLRRRLRTVDLLGGMRASVENKDCILFCTNNYLGLADHPHVLERSQKALFRYGASAQASRLVSGHLPIHQQLEEKTAAFKGSEACLAFPTGYMANLAAVSALVDEKDVILCDRLNHASLIDACRMTKAKFMVYEHLNLEDLKEQLEKTAKYRRRLVVTDGLFSMDGDLVPLLKLMELAHEYDALVMVDDAHGTGVLGPTGQGIIHHFPLKHFPAVVVGTYSKAMGSMGGFVCGSQLFIEYLLNKARTFIYTTGLPPSVCGASLGALEVMEQETSRVDKLWDNAKKIRVGLKALGYDIPRGAGPILPVMVGENEEALRMSKRLLEEGILIVAIRPPTVPKGTARLRLSVSAAHTDEDIVKLLDAFKKL
jgi:8-amino-7-oxononanoate synthase